MSKDTSRFVEKDSEGKEISVVVKRPRAKENNEATVYGNKVFAQAAQSGCLLRQKLDEYMREQGLWDDEKEDRLKELNKKILEGERQLARGGRTKDGSVFTKKQARDLAIDMRKWRNEQIRMLLKSRELDEYTAQSQAENAKHDYLVSCCTFDEEGKRLFKDIDDYNAKSDEPYAIKAASELAGLIHNYDENYEKNRIENKFLLEHKFVNEDLNLINDDGDLVDLDGRRINEQGHWINKDGKRVDINGELLDDDGNPIEEFTPFE